MQDDELLQPRTMRMGNDGEKIFLEAIQSQQWPNLNPLII